MENGRFCQEKILTIVPPGIASILLTDHAPNHIVGRCPTLIDTARSGLKPAPNSPEMARYISGATPCEQRNHSHEESP